MPSHYHSGRPSGADSGPNAITQPRRRYDVDWLRTLALGLLIIYHVMVSFQPWAQHVWFIQNGQSLQALWIFMALINVWRIPILFMISGMGVCFAMERRSWQQLLKDRALRILLPFVFGYFAICPINSFFAVEFYHHKAVYAPYSGHLWFLANIFIYVIILLPLLIYLDKRPHSRLFTPLARLLKTPWVLFAAALPVIAEALLVRPAYFFGYAMTPHGFVLGFISFCLGFTFVSLKDDFWRAVQKIRHAALLLAFAFYLVRFFVFRFQAEPLVLLSTESMCWMLAIFGYASLHLNRPSAALAYLSQAVYPVYIIHLPIQSGLAYYLLPLALPAPLKLALLLAGTFGLSLLIYHFGLRRLGYLRPLFGIKLQKRPGQARRA